MIKVLLIRHAQSVANTKKHLVSGMSALTPLSEEGEKQAAQLGVILQSMGETPSKVISSPAVRARDTARISLDGMSDVPDVVIADELREMSQGRFEGRPRDEVYTPEVKEQIKELGKDFSLPDQNAESMNDVADRIDNYISDLVSNAHSGSVLYVYTHGIAICCYIGKLLNLSQQEVFEYTRNLPNASVTELTFSSSDEPPIITGIGIDTVRG